MHKALYSVSSSNISICDTEKEMWRICGGFHRNVEDKIESDVVMPKGLLL